MPKSKKNKTNAEQKFPALQVDSYKEFASKLAEEFKGKEAQISYSIHWFYNKKKNSEKPVVASE